MDILSNINGYALDNDQRKAILSNDQNILVIAGAGSGKTLTIIGKIKYLIEHEKFDIKDILVISFTNEACQSLKNKLDYDIDVLTFHKLALNILKDNFPNITIAASDELEYVIKIFLESIIFSISALVMFS